MNGQTLTIDHATVGGDSLDDLAAAFEDIGMSPRYGGLHSNGVTHMSQLLFPDGSYLELLSDKTDDEPPRWRSFIESDGSLCAWCLAVDDIDAVAAQIADAGIDVDGPFDASRERPDGAEVRWRFAFPGPGDPGTYLPFLIQDETPRSERVPTRSDDHAGFGGIDRMVIGVEDLEEATNTYRRAFGLESPTRHHDPDMGGEVAVFEGEPVVLARPTDESGWLSQRLQAYGPSPAACVFAPGDASEVSHPTAGASDWGDVRVDWLDFAPQSWGKFGIVR